MIGYGKTHQCRILARAVGQAWLELEAWPSCSLESTGTGGGGGGGGWVDEMQNKAEAQPAWLQLAAGAAAGA